MKRLAFLLAIACLLPSLAAAIEPGAGHSDAEQAEKVFRFGITPVVLHEQRGNNDMLAAYLSRQLGRPVEVVQRQTYKKIMDMLTAGELDAAWICGLPFTRHSHELRLVAMPLNGFNDGKPLYRSLVIAGRDSPYHSLQDLKGATFAFADPDSNSGHLAQRYLLHRQGTNPDNFFKLYFFTYAHRNVVRAVAEGLADGGAVDSYVLKLLRVVEPELAARVEVVATSEEFAFPPIVANKGLADAAFHKLQAALTGMDRDKEGQKLLARMHLDGFIKGSASMYEPIAAMDHAVGTLATAKQARRGP